MSTAAVSQPTGPIFPVGPSQTAAGWPPVQPAPPVAPVGPDIKPGRRAPTLFQPVVLKDSMRFFQVPAMAWWWGLLGLVAFGGLLFLTMLLGSQLMNWVDPRALAQNTTTPAIFLLNNVWIAAIIPASVFVSFWFYRQGFGWLSSVIGRFRWKWFLLPLGVFVVGYIIENLIELLLFGANGYGLSGLTWQPTSLVMIVGIVLTTPLQCAGEEFMARGIVSRLIAAVIPQRQIGLILAAVGSSGLFMWLHSADDNWLNCYYFSTGLVLWWLAYRTGGLEASIALHMVNNLFSEWMLPFQDISGMFDRSAGTGSPAMLIYVVWEFLLALVVDYLARRRRLVRASAPAAAVPVVLKPASWVANQWRHTVVAGQADLPRLAKTPRLPATTALGPNQWPGPVPGLGYPVAPSYPPAPVYPPARSYPPAPVFPVAPTYPPGSAYPVAAAYPPARSYAPAPPPAYPVVPSGYPAAPPSYPAATPAYPAPPADRSGQAGLS